jgi:endonuclease-3
MRTDAIERPTERERARPRRRKIPFDIDDMIRRLRRATRPHTQAAMFELRDEGFDSVFEQLVACIISIRTLEEVTLPTARRLFAAARTPAQVAKFPVKHLDELIRTCTFHEPKARQIHAIAERCVVEFGGELPAQREVLLSFRGVGPKCANLALGIGANKPFGVPVDIHVHRVTNRWGYAQGATPEQTMVQLEQKLPWKYWLEINRLLVPFGKHICTMRLPKCSTCPVLGYCRQVGVTTHR